MSNKAENKERERVCVKIFKEAYSKFPQGKILDDENQEKPDFIVLTKNGKIGIEVTSIVDRKQKRSESECEKAVLEARRIYEMQHLPNLQVSVHIGCEKVFNKKNRSHFANAIAKQVINNTPPPKSYILIFNLPSLTQNHWHVPSGGICREDFEAELQDVLDEKESKIANYSPDCREQWLLVVAENMSASTFYEASEKTILHQYKSSFNKVFLLELFKGKLIELKLVHNA